MCYGDFFECSKVEQHFSVIETFVKSTVRMYMLSKLVLNLQHMNFACLLLRNWSHDTGLFSSVCFLRSSFFFNGQSCDVCRRLETMK